MARVEVTFEKEPLPVPVTFKARNFRTIVTSVIVNTVKVCLVK